MHLGSFLDLSSYIQSICPNTGTLQCSQLGPEVGSADQLIKAGSSGS